MHRYLYRDSLRINAVLDASGALKKRFIYSAKPHVLECMIDNATQKNYLLVTDHLALSVWSSMPTQIVKQRLDYDEWRRVTSDTNPGFQPFGFAGGLYDSDTKLVHFCARYYDPEVGRWLSRDPILFAGGDSNLYQYVCLEPLHDEVRKMLM